MKNSKPKVVKVIYNTFIDSERKKIVLFNDGKMLDEPIVERHWYMAERPENISNRQYIFLCDFIIQFGDKEYIRSDIPLHCNGGGRKILKIDVSLNLNRFMDIFRQ